MIIRDANEADIDTLVTLLRSSFSEVAERFELTIENCPKNLAFCTKERVKSDLARNLKYGTTTLRWHKALALSNTVRPFWRIIMA
jgi:hypothetical protein